MWAPLHYSYLSLIASLFNLTGIIRAKYSRLHYQTPKPFTSPFRSPYPANNEPSLVIMNRRCSLESIVSHPWCFINSLESQSPRAGTPDFQSHLDQWPYFANIRPKEVVSYPSPKRLCPTQAIGPVSDKDRKIWTPHSKHVTLPPPNTLSRLRAPLNLLFYLLCQ